MPKKQAAAAPALTAAQLALYAEWSKLLEWLAIAKPRELEIRRQLAAELCPNPTEGSNNLLTADGYEVSLDHKINRKLDEQALDSVMLALPEDAAARQPGVLIQYKPSLVLTGYRNLPPDQLKIFQQALEEKPGAPDLAIIKVEAEGAAPAPAIEANPEGGGDPSGRGKGRKAPAKAAKKKTGSKKR